ncbi:hypothetical protein SAMN05216327_101247 [Dyadobacter sp. SG02]|uniref:hypothetical protein n=1 Tax=Dyadobacter sp. SG02 TaxID=1855291 RepID=UPI0008B537FD|nr:hypothetical protein [Dyadobacter sp. SG02]SEI40031.1 hypothetical protein SAMN05216327_101247 [Dyadobacter sp. SG02]
MQHSYFKIRDPWNFKPHRFEIGTPFIRSSFHDNHFFLKLYELRKDDFSDFYDFHLRHYLQNVSSTENDFHSYVSDIVSTRIAQQKLIDPFSRKALRVKQQTERLRTFQTFLHSIDNWSSSLTLEAVIAENNREIVGLKQQITELKDQLEALRRYETKTKIDIRDKHLPTFIHLIHQLQQLMLPDERRLFNFQEQSGWYKLVSKYFTHDRKPIPIETARNYFPVQKEKTSKEVEVPEHLRFFKIILTSSESGS